MADGFLSGWQRAPCDLAAAKAGLKVTPPVRTTRFQLRGQPGGSSPTFFFRCRHSLVLSWIAPPLRQISSPAPFFFTPTATPNLAHLVFWGRPTRQSLDFVGFVDSPAATAAAVAVALGPRRSLVATVAGDLEAARQARRCSGARPLSRCSPFSFCFFFFCLFFLFS